MSYIISELMVPHVVTNPYLIVPSFQVRGKRVYEGKARLSPQALFC